MDDDHDHIPRRSVQIRSFRQLAHLSAAFLILLLLATACGGGSNGPSVASTDPTASATAASSSGNSTNDSAPSAAAYSQCMRAHGISDFPDPNANGDLAIETHPGSDIDPNAPAYQAADTACKPLMPAQEPMSDAQRQELRSQNLKYAQCMRQNGVTDFPDPKDDGTLQVQANPGSDLDPNSTVYQDADQQCKQYLPDSGGGRSTSDQP